MPDRLRLAITVRHNGIKLSSLIWLNTVSEDTDNS